MDIQTIIDAVNKIPTLEEKINFLEQENYELKRSLDQMNAANELINVDRGAEILGLTKNTTRKIFHEIGASRVGKRLIVSSNQLIKWHEQNRSNSSAEIERAAEMYCLKKPLRKKNTPRSPLKRGEVV